MNNFGSGKTLNIFYFYSWPLGFWCSPWRTRIPALETFNRKHIEFDGWAFRYGQVRTVLELLKASAKSFWSFYQQDFLTAFSPSSLSFLKQYFISTLELSDPSVSGWSKTSALICFKNTTRSSILRYSLNTFITATQTQTTLAKLRFTKWHLLGLAAGHHWVMFGLSIRWANDWKMDWVMKFQWLFCMEVWWIILIKLLSEITWFCAWLIATVNKWFINLLCITVANSWTSNSYGKIIQDHRKGSFTDFKIIEKAGHHIYTDNAPEFNKSVLEACGVLKSQRKWKF